MAMRGPGMRREYQQAYRWPIEQPVEKKRDYLGEFIIIIGTIITVLVAAYIITLL